VNRRLSSCFVALSLGAVLAACGSDNANSSTASTAAPPVTTASSGTASTGAPVGPLRDVRYCEVIPSITQGSSTTTYVYNTLTFNFCPPDQWNALTESTVNQEYGSQSAQLNGPRHWVIDQLTATGGTTSSGKTFTFGGIEMGLRATLSTPAGQPTVGDQFYTPNSVARDTIWTYQAGRPIFTLTAPNGDVYVMQSYSQSKDPALTIKQLPDLGAKLTLPAGWTYGTQTLTQDLNLNSDGLATVVNDDYYNSYQKR
jgi:hypothetical protein